MRIAVTDANIFIDILYLDMHHHLVSLDLEIVTTQFVIDELDDDQIGNLGELISNGKLVIYPFTEDDLSEFSSYSIKRSLSTADHSVIFIAQKVNAMVISGDSVVRSTCEQLEIEVHGILWLFDECISCNQLTMKQAHAKLTDLMTFNKWLPKKECNARLARWI